MSINELNSTARDLMSIRAMIEELQAEAEALTDKLKAAMVDQKTEVLRGDGWKATWKNVSSSRFDSKAFKTDHTDLPAINQGGFFVMNRNTTTRAHCCDGCPHWKLLWYSGGTHEEPTHRVTAPCRISHPNRSPAKRVRFGEEGQRNE